MNTIPLHVAASTLVLGAILAVAPRPAHADYKTSSGGACQPFGSTTTTDDLRYLVNGVTPRNDTDEVVLCNLVADSEYTWYSATTDADVSLFFKAGSMDAPVSCTATTGSSYMYGSLSYTKSMTIPATLTGTLNITGMLAPGSYSWAPFSVTCQLPARAVLARIVLKESAAT